MTIEELQKKLESLENGQVKKEDIEALKAEIAKMTPEVKKDDIEKLDKALNDLNAKMEKLDKGISKKMTFEEAIKEVFERPEVKAAIESKSFKDGLSLELKVATSDVTGGTASVSLIDNEKIFAVSRPLAFVGQLPTAQVGTNKNRVVWIEGAYTSNAGYVGEGAAQAKADTAPAVEKSRAMAKASAKIKVTAEMFEDYSYIASEIQSEMMNYGLLFLDNEIYGGDGNDSTQPNHVYGLKSQGTAFSAAKSGRVGNKGVVAPNLGDLADAMKVQARVIDAANPTKKAGFVPNRIYINPVNASILRTTKSTDGQYIIRQMADGTSWMAGMQVVETQAVGATELLALDTNAVKLYFKRNPEIMIGREGTDLTQDLYTIVMFVRAQAVVKGDNKYGIIYCADTAAALTAITYSAS